MELGDRTGSRQEAAAGVLAVDPELDCVSPRGGVFGQVQLLAVGDAELLADQVDPRGLLGDRVFDLKTGVDLQEGDQAVLADQVFDRAGAVVVGLFADPLGRLVDLLALGVGEERCRSLFDQLLVAALQRAVAGTGDHDVAVLVGDHLRLDVARLVQVALDKALAAAECRGGLAHRRLVELGNLFHGAGDLHAAPAATEGRLDGDRQPVLLGEGDHFFGVLDRVGSAGHQGRLGAGGDVAGGDLVAEVADGLRAGTDPDQAGVDHGLGEVGVLRQEAVAGVDRVGAGLRGRVEELLKVQVGLGGSLAAQGERLVSQADVRGLGVGFGVDRHAGQARVPGRPDHSDCDLAAIGHENLGDPGAGVTGHCASCRAGSLFVFKRISYKSCPGKFKRRAGSSVTRFPFHTVSRSRRLIRASIADIPRSRNGLIRSARPSSL
ncbi:hypothetical protein NJB1604_36460 [Mycobacterium marinum]|nr:hypothetical protein NJB1604_36460 [Mycobacterium marinum]